MSLFSVDGNLKGPSRVLNTGLISHGYLIRAYTKPKGINRSPVRVIEQRLARVDSESKGTGVIA